jgi:hypothetical protein
MKHSILVRATAEILGAILSPQKMTSPVSATTYVSVFNYTASHPQTGEDGRYTMPARCGAPDGDAPNITIRLYLYRASR